MAGVAPGGAEKDDMTGLLVAIVAAIGLSLLGREAWGWLPRLSRAVIWLQTAPLPRERRAIRRVEWHAELAGEYEDRRLTGFMWALSLCRISAWERLTTPIAFRSAVRRAARRDVSLTWRTGLVAGLSMTTAILNATQLLGAGTGWMAVLAAGLAALAIGTVLHRSLLGTERAQERELALKCRRMWVVSVLEDLGHISHAQSIGELRAWRASFPSDVIWAPAADHPVVRDAMPRAQLSPDGEAASAG
ncbi:MAG: hypothetical protein V7607_2574 [Solirubrobacteraceae bacterium]